MINQNVLKVDQLFANKAPKILFFEIVISRNFLMFPLYVDFTVCTNNSNNCSFVIAFPKGIV